MLRIQLGLRSRVEDLRSWIDLKTKGEKDDSIRRICIIYPEDIYFSVFRVDLIFSG